MLTTYNIIFRPSTLPRPNSLGRAEKRAQWFVTTVSLRAKHKSPAHRIWPIVYINMDGRLRVVTWSFLLWHSCDDTKLQWMVHLIYHTYIRDHSCIYSLHEHAIAILYRQYIKYYIWQNDILSMYSTLYKIVLSNITVISRVCSLFCFALWDAGKPLPKAAAVSSCVMHVLHEKILGRPPSKQVNSKSKTPFLFLIFVVENKYKHIYIYICNAI